jgi:predicted RNA binding protein YcfA (HicA-like mRNA interferase family)
MVLHACDFVQSPAKRKRQRMSKLAFLKVSAILKLIADDGWSLSRQKGSHRQFKHQVKSGLVTVPGKPSDDLHPKTRDSILRQAGLKQDGSQIDEKRKEGGS